MNVRITAWSLGILWAATLPALAQTTYDWDGSQNNNWDNGPNWSGASGWPDDPSHNVRFDAAEYGSNTEVDLRGGTFDVGNINLNNALQTIDFVSNNNGQGTIRLNGNILYEMLLGFPTGPDHVFDVDLEVVNDCTWTAGDAHRLTINGELRGSGDITLQLTNDPEAFLGSHFLRLNNANSYNGRLTIRDGYVSITDPNALQNASVTLDFDNGLRMAGNINGNIRSLAGEGNLRIGTGVFTTTSNANSTFNGRVTGDSTTTSIFSKKGPANLVLTDNVSGLLRLQNSDGGQLLLDGNTVSVMELVSGAGNLAVRNGADVTLNDTGTASSGAGGSLIVEDAGSVLHSGHELAVTTGTGSGTVDIRDEGLVQDFDIVTVGKLGTGQLIVQSDGRIEASAMGIGGKDASENGGTGTVDVAGATIEIEGETRFWTSSSSLAVFGNGQVLTGTLTNPAGTSPQISIADPTSGEAALIVGSDTAMPTSIFTGTIVDTGVVSGSVNVVGINEVVLAGANFFTGGVTVDGTFLAENTSGSASGPGGVIVNDGGTFGGNGICAGETLVRNGGTLSPGTSAGTLTLDNATLQANATLLVEISATPAESDLLAVNDTATLNGTLDLRYIAPFTADAGDTFIVVSAGTLSGEFDNVIYPDSQTWYLEYDTSAGTVLVGVCSDDDGDGTCNDVDICPGADDLVDDDNDGVPNGCDLCPGFDDTADDDGDSVPNGCDTCDGDDATGDPDNDRVCTSNDGCPNDPDKTEPGICGCGVSDNDTDNDGTADCNDGCPNDPDKTEPGICGCGISDNDTDNDGTADCNDGCPNDPDKTEPGICGCGTADADEDDDGFLACFDCDDSDPDVNPDQAEVYCDGIDNDCIGDTQDNPADFCSVQAPNFAPVGPRYVEITPAAHALPVALYLEQVGGECGGKYVDFDDNRDLAAQGICMLVDLPVYRTAEEWGTLLVRGELIVPETAVTVQAEVQTIGLADSPVQATPFRHADVNDNGQANFEDILLIVQGFQGTFAGSVGAVDLEPCIPNGVVNLADVQQGVFAFQGAEFSCQFTCTTASPVAMEEVAPPITVEMDVDTLHNGGDVKVDVRIADAIDLHTFQFALELVDGAGQVRTADEMIVNPSNPEFLFGGIETISAASPASGTCGAVSMASGIDVTNDTGAYAATFLFQGPFADGDDLTIRYRDDGNLARNASGHALPIIGLDAEVTLPIRRDADRKHGDRNITRRATTGAERR